MRRPIKSIAGAALVAGLLVTPSQAQAAVSSSYSMATVLGGNSAGQARATGAVTWTSSQAASIKLSIRDVCPGDGRGAYMRAIVINSKSINNTELLFVGSDVNGCGTAAESFTKTLPNGGAKICSVRLRLYESDGGTFHDPGDDYVDKVIRNPYGC